MLIFIYGFLFATAVYSFEFKINWSNLRTGDYLPPAFDEEVEDEQRIVGGQVAKPNSYPHQVGLVLAIASGKQGWCGGSIISTRFVLTAAHCLEKVKNVTIIMGAHDRLLSSESGRMTVRAGRSNFIIHQSWNMNGVRNDIALIKVSNPIRFTDKIAAVSLPTQSHIHKTFEGSMAVITGWGNYEGNGLSKYLRFTNARVISNERCKQYFRDLVRDSVMCLDGSRGNGTCFGDSGGPLTIQEENLSFLAGITSFGSRYGCQAKWPTAFTRITSYLGWLSKYTDVNILL